MVNKTTQAAQAFNGANGAAGNINVAAMHAFINANGMGNVALQFTPNALANGVLFGGGKLWAVMQPNKQGVISARGLMLWACVNGVPQHTVKGVKCFNVAGINTKVPSKLTATPLVQCHAAMHIAGTHANGVLKGGSGVLCNANSAHTNQNAVAAILNGAFALSSQTVATYGTAFGKLVLAS